MTAREIIDRLAERHAKDLFVPECKDGPTYVGSHLRLDAWAMKRSWADYCTYGYEVKISRSDFVRDDKMRNYLPLCHEFYVVAPAGIVESLDELPEGAGLIIASPNHHRLIAKRKAKYREIPDPILVYRYILMARARIEQYDGFGLTPKDTARFWAGWLERREIDRDLGHRVSKTIRETVQKRIELVEEENRQLKQENAAYADVKRMLVELGITRLRGSTWGVREKLEAYKKGFPEDLQRTLHAAETYAESLAGQIKEIEKILSVEKRQGSE